MEDNDSSGPAMWPALKGREGLTVISMLMKRRRSHYEKEIMVKGIQGEVE